MIEKKKEQNLLAVDNGINFFLFLQMLIILLMTGYGFRCRHSGYALKLGHEDRAGNQGAAVSERRNI